MPPSAPPAQGLAQELRTAWQRGRQVWRMVSGRDKSVLWAAGMLMAVVGAAAAAVKYLLGELVNSVERYKESDAETFFRVCLCYLLGIAGLFLLSEAIQVVRKYLVQNTMTRIERDRVVSLVTHLLRVDLTVLGRERVGGLHGRISRSVEGFVKFIKILFQDVLPAMFMAGFALLAVFAQNWKVGLLAAGVLPASAFIVIRQIQSQKGIRIELMKTREGADATVVEQLGGIEYIRAANTQEIESGRVRQTAELRREKEIRHHTAMALFDCAKTLNEGLFLILVIALSIYLARLGEIGYGSIMSFSLQFLAISGAVREMHRILDEAHESSLRVAMLLELMALPVDRSFGQVTLREPEFSTGVPVIQTDGLCVEFRTPEGHVRQPLNGVTMAIGAGETIGAAGPSGSGKSTWLKVLMRLLHPSAGRVHIGGIPIETLSRDSIGRLIGYVGQNPFIFAGSVAENIAYGIPGAKREAVEEAAKRASIHDEILLLPGGYDALLAERGSNLSGGQRQRIAIARVFLKNPPILILDEGTSALDNISERQVQHAITAARAERTTILVAHRLSTLRDADRIFVFEDGRIAEVGDYDSLVRQQGTFYRLVKSAESQS
jgi:ATP-binding cassette subfamily B protein